MSLLLATGAAVGGFFIASQYMNEQNRILSDSHTPGTVAQHELHSGRYGDNESIGHLLASNRALITHETVTEDLQGTPCRWIGLSNGAVYKTYDMHHPAINGIIILASR